MVLPRRCGALSPGSIPGHGAVCPYGLKSKLVSAGFSPGTPPGGGGGALKYNSVHMRDQNFFKTPLNEFSFPDENHPLNEFT